MSHEPQSQNDGIWEFPLQFHHDLIFCKDPTIASEYNAGHQAKQNKGNGEGWDEKLLEDGEDDDKMDLEPDGDDNDDIFLFQ